MMLGAPDGGSALPSTSALLRKPTPSRIDALLGRRLAFEHLLAIDDARVLLDEVVARARRHVVAVAPDRRPRIVGKERPQELVAVVRAHRIVARADRVAHRVGPLRALSAATGLCAPTTLARRRRWRRRWRRRLKERRRLPRLSRHPDRTDIRFLAGRPDARADRVAPDRAGRAASRPASGWRSGRSEPRRRRC